MQDLPDMKLPISTEAEGGSDPNIQLVAYGLVKLAEGLVQLRRGGQTVRVDLGLGSAVLRQLQLIRSD